MHVKLIAVLQNKRDIRHRSFDFVGLFLLEHLSVKVSCWFLASHSSKIQTTVEDFTSHIKYMLPNFLYFHKVLCMRVPFIF